MKFFTCPQVHKKMAKNATNMSDKKDIFVKIFAGDEIWQIFNKIVRKKLRKLLRNYL